MIWTACGRENEADQPVDHQNDDQHQQRDAEGKVKPTKNSKNLFDLSPHNLCFDIGVPIALILPSLPDYDSGFEPRECHDFLNEALAASLPLAKELGITLMIANLGSRSDIYGQADWVVQTCQALPELRMVYDVGNFVMAGEDPVTALDKVFPYMIHVHLKDWITFDSERPGESWLGHGGKWYQGCLFGKGIVPLRTAVDRLKQLGYDGLVSPEYEGPDDPYEVMGQSIDYSRALLASESIQSV